LLQSMLGMSMIACLLEDEREATELATVEMERLAYHDAMTGLPNRPLYMDRLILALAQAGRSNQRLAVFFLDLDRLRTSTIRSATRWATRCSRRSRSGSAAACAKATPWP